MRRTLVAAVTALTTAAVVSGAAVADASPSRPDRVPQEHFRIISTVTNSRRQSVLATGAFTAGGYLVPGRLVALRSTDRVVLSDGSFLMTRHITRQWLPLPTRNCLVRETIHGTFSLSHGTGAYRGISGSGAFVMKIRGVLRHTNGQCGGAMTVYQMITWAGGKVRR